MLEAGNTGIRMRVLLTTAVLVAAVAALAGPARAAEPFTVKSDIAYAPQNEQRGSNLLDVYVPNRAAQGRRPVFVWIHGGGWFQGDKKSATMAFKARTLVRAGFIFVSVNYRLSPDLDGPLALTPGRVRFPTPHRDAARALGWVSKHIAEYGGNANRMVIGGDSAGGQIASLLATRPAFLDAQGVSTRQIRGVLSLDSIGFDVARMMTPAYRKISAGFQRMMFNAFGTPAEERKAPAWDAASPIRFADPADPPFFHVVPTSSADRWVEAQKMSRLLRQRFDLISWRVDTNHPGVVPLLGNPAGDMGVTARAVRFVRAAVSPVIRSRVVVRGSRTVRAAGKSKFGILRLQISSRPRARQVTCQLNGGRETLCPRSWKLRAGAHKLRITTYDDTGQARVSRLFPVKVLP